MIEMLLTPFQYQYMVKAILVSGLIGGVCAFLSCFITLKGWSLMGDALSHSVVPGVAIAYALGLPFAAGAFGTGLLAAVGMGFVKAKTRLREDAVIGVVFTAFFALGLFLISLNPSSVDLRTIVFGNILGISDSDILQVIIISAVTLIVLGLKWRDLLLFCFDANQARALGLNVTVLHYTLLTLLSATAVAALQTVGATLVVAMLVTPGATAYLLTDRFGRMIGIAVALGVGTSIVGAYASYYFDGSTGGCIVTLQSFLFVVALIFAPKHGLRAARAKPQTRGDGTPPTLNTGKEGRP
jgi:manganese/iron transport system permease protein